MFELNLREWLLRPGSISFPSLLTFIHTCSEILSMLLDAPSVYRSMPITMNDVDVFPVGLVQDSRLFTNADI